MEWIDGNTAPKGGLEDREGEIKNGKTKGDKFIYQTWVSPRIIGCRKDSISGEFWVTETMWLPPSKELREGRWAKFTDDRLDKWMPLPKGEE